MKINKALKNFLDNAKQTDSYWVEKAKLDFSLSLEKQRRIAGMTYAAIAEKIGTSAAYITKVFRGDANLTIETMVKLSRATGGNLTISIEQPGSVKTIIGTGTNNLFWFEKHKEAKAANQQWITDTTVSDSPAPKLKVANYG